ncbi:hypothetical protein F4778DRAFT_768899 [Xylariomycetidae sp. FL2044]|nr:hypothetical protein F4778DRAFT_768899 [Xylariomycetidae sp. FL2044]
MSKKISNCAKLPPSRFDIDAYFHPDNERPGSFNVSGGYFLEDNPDLFDPGFFKISPVEAMCMDTQQRKLLEVVFEAIESSGTNLDQIAGQMTGCFETDFRHMYVSTGGDTGILSSRISYLFGLKGPSVMVSTACSSSLYALDLACKAISAGECDSAIVGGVNLILQVDQQMNTAKLGVLSPTNQCHSFDESADGCGRAEGLGAIYIKSLSAAMENGDPIRAVIRSTASSGRCPDGMTHPSQHGQVQVMSLAYRLGNMAPEHTAYVECHGTGTPVGDPIEAAAIQAGMGVTRGSDSPVLIGSIKPNFGHSEAASSMATIVKATLALENGIIPPTAGITRLNTSTTSMPLPTVLSPPRRKKRYSLLFSQVYGHSSGEMGAAYAAGRLSTEAAITAAYFQGKAVGLRCDGAMLAVSLGIDSVSSYIDPGDGVVVACHNAPESITLSGDCDAIQKLKQIFDFESIFARILNTNGQAYHSQHMKEAAAPYRDHLDNQPRDCYQTLREVGNPGSEIPNTYWVENLCMLNQQPEINTFIEVGPHPALIGSIKQICHGRQEHDVQEMLQLAGNPWTIDASMDIESVVSTEVLSQDGASIEFQKGSLLVDLPPYQWTYQKSFWSEPRLSKELRVARAPRHDILGRRLLGGPPSELVWRNHRPGALAIESITQANETLGGRLDIQSYIVRDIVISNAIVVPDDEAGTETLFRLQPLNENSVLTLCCTYGTWKEAGLRSLGIDLGPSFHHISSVYTDGSTNIARGDMSISQQCGLMELESRYVLHPTTLDACIQLCLVAKHRGRVESVRLTTTCGIQAWTDEVGNRVYNSHCQLVSSDGTLLADISRCRGLLYSSAIPPHMRGYLQRHLYTKLEWKVDADYLKWADHAVSEVPRSLAIVTDILLHKTPGLRIICLDEALASSILAVRPTLSMTVMVTSQETSNTLNVLRSDNEGLALVEAEHMSEGSAEATSDARNQYDLAICLDVRAYDGKIAPRLAEKLAPDGRLLTWSDRTSFEEDEYDLLLNTSGLTKVQQLSSGVTILRPRKQLISGVNTKKAADTGRVLFVHLGKELPLQLQISAKMAEEGWEVYSQSLNSLGLAGGEYVILFIDVDCPLLAQLNEEQLGGLAHLTENAASIVWLTCGGLLTGDRPEFGMTLGAARTIRKEKGSLDLVTVDFDTVSASVGPLVDLVADIIERQREHGRNGETEYFIKDGIVYVARLVSHGNINRQFVPESGETSTLHQQDDPALHGLYVNGKVVFKQDIGRGTESLAPDSVEIHVAAVGLTAFDGSDDVAFLSHEVAGTVTRVGAEAKHIKPGRNVVGFAFGQLATFQHTSENLLQPLSPGSSLVDAVTLPSASLAAIYGLEYLARVNPGESVLIVDDIGTAGLIAVQLCRILKANAAMVTGSTATKDWLVRSGLLTDEKIIPSQDRHLSEKLDLAIGAKGFDVLLCSTDVDEMLSAECLRMLAPFGRVITIRSSSSRKSVLTGILPDYKSLSLSCFDPIDVIRLRPDVTARILERSIEMYNNGQIYTEPLVNIKTPGQINEVLHSIPNDLGSGKNVISYDKSDAAYLMVGCLGGLGRRVALWMAQKGAKHMIFVSQSGTRSRTAMETVETLQKSGVRVLVLQADVARREELVAALAKIDRGTPVKGILNAAGIFNDKIFANMTIEAWREVTDAKVEGCLNLHHAFEDQTLDFFVMTGSIASILGSSGQSNYSAGNAFLDALACHRRCRGLPAVSLILPAIFGIGHIAEHAELKQIVESKGTYGVLEKEMLDAFEVAMTPQRDLPMEVDHICVGIQPLRFGMAVNKSGIHPPWKDDPRFSWIGLAADAQGSDPGYPPGTFAGSSESVMSTIQQTASRDKAVDTATESLVRRLARVLMIDERSVEPSRDSVSSLGLDSMIGAEFRNWMFREFSVNVPFQQLLAGSFTIRDLAEMLCEKISAGKP